MPPSNIQCRLTTGEHFSLPLSIHLFGPMEVLLYGVPMPQVRSRKSHGLLALLLLRHGREVRRSWLAGVLWPETPASQAAAYLRRELHDLRRVLGPEANRLSAPTSRTLALSLAGAMADVAAFDAATSRGDLASLEVAVELYRGPLLEDWDEEWVFQERQAREQAYLAALERLAEHSMAADDLPSAERHLRRAIAVDPLHESAHRGLMQVLAAGGGYAAALLTYRELRLLLHRELNAEPDAETTELFERLRAEARQKAESRQGPGTARDRRGAVQPPFQSQRDRREELLAPGSILPPLHNLPAQPTSLLGREQAVAAARELLLREDVRLLTLTGPGGAGKTRLGLQVASDLLPQFRDGVFLVSLAPVSDPNLVISAIAGPLGVHEARGGSLLDGLYEYLREKQLLLLLDNFEHLLEAASMVARLLEAAPQLKTLITSRAVLHLRGEYEFPVPPLPLPDPNLLPATAVELASALRRFAVIRLFCERATAVSPGFAITAENAPAVAEICARLDGLPLAIELAAAWTRLLPPRTLLSWLTGNSDLATQGGRPRGSPLRLLTRGARDLPERHQALRDTIGWSYHLLEEAEQRLFRRLTVFSGGFELDAAQGVGASGDDGGIEVLRGLASLVEKSLLHQRGQEKAEPRFLMLETVREFGWEALVECGEADDVRGRHGQFFLRLAEEAAVEISGRDQAAWFGRLETEHDNLRAAMAWTLESGAAELGLRMGAALDGFWRARGFYTEGRGWLARLLALPAAQQRTAARARALQVAGGLAAEQGDPEIGQSLCEAGLAIARDLDAPALVRSGSGSLASALMRRRNLDGAEPLFNECLAIARSQNDQGSVAGTLSLLGVLARHQGDLARARALMEDSLRIRRELGDRSGMASVINNLGGLAAECGDFVESHGFYRELLAMGREMGARPTIAKALNGLGCSALDLGRFDEADNVLEEANAAFREIGDRWEIANTCGALGDAARARGDYQRAATCYEENRTINAALGREPARAWALKSLGLVAIFQGEFSQAHRLFQECIAVRQAANDRAGIANCLAGFAGIAAGENDPVRSARLMGAAACLHAANGTREGAVDSAEHSRYAAAARAQLGESDYMAAEAAGRALSPEAAINFALRAASDAQ